jgi:hypothetical protein
MTLILVAALVAVVIADKFFSDRRDKRERSERADLLQRIQAPQAAVTAHHAAATGPVAVNDGLPMSDEEIAEQQERDRMISWLEAAENNRLSLVDGASE